MTSCAFRLSKFLLCLTTSLLTLTAIVEKTFAVDVAWEGYFRSRGNFFYNLDLDRSQTPEIRGFTDMRFRLNPTFFVTDRIRIKSSLNLLDGTLGDNPLRTAPYHNPATPTHDVIDPSGREATIGRGQASNLSSGGVYTADGQVQTAGLTPLQVRRAWAEMDTPFGILKVGRMPFHLGLGIYANAGDDPSQEVGTTRDRVIFETSFGPYYVKPGFGWTVEGNLDSSADDFYEYYFSFGRKIDQQELGIYIGYNTQDAYTPEAGVTSVAFNQVETSYWVVDFFGSHRFSSATLGGEFAIYTGKVLDKDLLAFNGAVRSVWDVSKAHLLTELGYSSGTSQSDANRNNIRSVAFSRDYDVALILFEEALPGGESTEDTTGTRSGVATAPHSGAVANALYGRARLGYEATSYFHPAINILMPYTAKKVNNAGFYGIEYDLITEWPVHSYFTGHFSFGHFIPFEVYDRYSNNKSESALLLRAGITAAF